jgi:two-component system, cell cycle response regulator DivK
MTMKARILYIEDNEQNLYLVKFLLENNGYEVRQATNGRDGIRMAMELKPDLILLDIELPGMDGYAVARELKSVPNLARVAVVGVSSYAMAGDRENALEAGCSGYIEKPIDPDTFVSQLERYLTPPNGIKR